MKEIRRRERRVRESRGQDTSRERSANKSPCAEGRESRRERRDGWEELEAMRRRGKR